MDNLWYLVAAYGVIWLGLFVYLVSVARQASELRHQLHVLRRALRELETKSAAPRRETLHTSAPALESEGSFTRPSGEGEGVAR